MIPSEGCGLDSLLKVDLETNFVYRCSTARKLVSAIEEVRVRKYVSEGVGTMKRRGSGTIDW